MAFKKGGDNPIGRPFKPGQSGNLPGRPSERELSLGELLRKRVSRPRTKSQIAAVLIDMATKGKSEATRLSAVKLIMEAIEGKPAQKSATKPDTKLEVVFGDADQTA